MSANTSGTATSGDAPPTNTQPVATASPAPSTAPTRESVPFTVVDAEGNRTQLAYSSPRPATEHDETALVEQLPWFDHDQPLHNWMLHETDFYDEVEQIWGRRWG